MTFPILRTIVGALTVAVVCAGCAGTSADLKPNSEELLIGTSWQLGKLGDQPAIDGAQPTLQFIQSGKIAGTGSCNRFTGSVTVSGDKISFGPLASTRMACADRINAQEAEYFKALGEAHRFKLQGSALQIYTKTIDGPLLFVKTTPN